MALVAVLMIATPVLALGTVDVSGDGLTIDLAAAPPFVGVDETTALVYAVLAHCQGQSECWGKNMNFPAPDTGQLGCDSLTELWHQYFWLCDHYDLNLVRIGAADLWGTKALHEAWKADPTAFTEVLQVMLHEAEEHGVYVCLVLAGSQQYPVYAFGGPGSPLDADSLAYSNYLAYCASVISIVDGLDRSSALFSYDVWNEPDHISVNEGFWHGDQPRFREWASGVSAVLCPLTEHIVEMGTGGYTGPQGLWSTWQFSSFLNITGLTGFDVCHLHFYASVEDEYLVTDPLNWSEAVGKPLHWGELAKNEVYPLQRWTWFESRLAAHGADAWCSMVLRGTPGYPFTGTIPEDEEPSPGPGDEQVPDAPGNETGPGNQTEPPPSGNGTMPGNHTDPVPPSGNGTDPNGPSGNDTAPGNETEPLPPSGNGTAPPPQDGTGPGNETGPPAAGDGTEPGGGVPGDMAGERATNLKRGSLLGPPMALIAMALAMMVLHNRGRRRF